MSALSRPEFHDEAKAFEHLERIIWNGSPVCPHCGGVDRITKVKANPDKRIREGLWRCGDCKRQFTVKIGTVFEHMRLPLHKALQAVFLMTSSKKGVSAHQLHRTLEITYKSAWFLAHRIREAMRSGDLTPMGGSGVIVEADETFIGRLKGERVRSGVQHKMKARSNSPGYPNLSLPKAISLTRKMWDADRQNPIDRVTAAKHMGYGGQSGASDKALGSLAHYGLTEKTGKGEIRVSQLAVDILCPDPTDPGSEARAVWRAGMNPQVFSELRSRFPGHVSEESLRNYLTREGFNTVAIQPVMNAFFETFRFLEQYKDTESDGPRGASGGESGPLDDQTGASMEDTIVMERPASQQTPPPVAQVEPGEAEWMRNPLGRDTAVRLLVTGKMGSREIGKLIKLLEAQKAILEDDDEEDPVATLVG